MLKPKHVAPIFSMSPIKLSELLKELHMVYPIEQTPYGSFLIKDSDLAMIEMYNKTLVLFNDKKLALQHVQTYVHNRELEVNPAPDWIYLIKRQKSG